MAIKHNEEFKREAVHIALSSGLAQRQPRQRAALGSIAQAGQALRIKAMRPIAQCLMIHVSLTRRIRAAHPVQHRSNRQ